MNVKVWVWCLHCERCFEAYVRQTPRVIDGQLQSTFEFATDFEMQFGREHGGKVYAICPYPGCDGSLLDFWWWAEYRREHPEAPGSPVADTVYPL